jgi:hypothetical protein
MIRITSCLHRERLRDLIRRWMYNEAHPADAEEIARLVHFNNAYISRYLPAVAQRVFGCLHAGSLEARRVRRKAELKDTIVAQVPCGGPRVAEMLEAYAGSPGLYYRETPFHGTLYFAPGAQGPVFIGSTRIKRARRLAEKSARRISDWIYGDIKQRADRLALDRARRLGVPLEALVTPPEEMIEEFSKAETRLLEDLKSGRPLSGLGDMVIQDVAGIKVLVEEGERKDFLERLGVLPDCEIVEIEAHRGRYNAVNLILRHRPEREALLVRPLSPRLIQVMQARGVAPRVVEEQFGAFVREAEPHVNLEVIVCDYQEMLESEIGRCMHEDRILRQRQNEQYTGQLARNIEFLMAYLFAFPVSARGELGELPIRLWDRYLPDYFDEVLRGLFNIPSVEVLE